MSPLYFKNGYIEKMKEYSYPKIIIIGSFTIIIIIFAILCLISRKLGYWNCKRWFIKKKDSDEIPTPL